MRHILPPDDRSFAITPKKGHYENLRMVAWTAVSDCTGERCRIYTECNYNKDFKCGLMKQYLSTICEMIHREFRDLIMHPERGEKFLFQIGMHLLPLYKTLGKLKMEEHAVLYPVYMSEKGIRKADPVYKEIRDTIKLIQAMWKELGLNAPVPPQAFPDPSASGADSGYTTMFGRPDKLPDARPVKPSLFTPEDDTAAKETK